MVAFVYLASFPAVKQPELDLVKKRAETDVGRTCEPDETFYKGGRWNKGSPTGSTDSAKGLG